MNKTETNLSCGLVKDFSIVDFSPFMYSGANITGMRMVDLENPKAIAVVDRWKKDLERSSFSLSPIGRDQTQVSVSSNIGGSRNIVFFQGEGGSDFFFKFAMGEEGSKACV